MSKMPERIWATTYSGKKDAGYWHNESDVWNGIEYVRADLVTPPQITDAMVEAALLATLGRNWPTKETMRAALAAALGVKE